MNGDTLGTFWFIMNLCVGASKGLLCYNCSATHMAPSRCAGDFATSYIDFNGNRSLIIKCAKDSAMCFVRSWSTRAHHSWLVQRGCYHPTDDDPLPRSLNRPTRALTCKHERYPEAEYKVCLCQADWCNSSSKLIYPFVTLKVKTVIFFTLFLFTCYRIMTNIS